MGIPVFLYRKDKMLITDWVLGDFQVGQRRPLSRLGAVSQGRVKLVLFVYSGSSGTQAT
jgi:hypothetical protein